MCRLSSNDENVLNASRFSGQRAPGDFNPSAMTIGKYTVAPGVRVYEQFQDGAQVAVPLSSLDFGTIPQDQIASVHLNGSDVADLIILNNVTGDAYMYGRMVGTTVTTGEGEDAQRRTSWSLENRTTTKFNEHAGYAGKSGDFIGAVAGKNNMIISVVQLKELKQVSPASFFEREGQYYVTVQGQTYPVAANVECYKDATESWFDQENGVDRLNACMAFSDNLTLYVDPVGKKVRIIIAN